MYDCFYQCPPGMKQQVLTFYTKLLAHVRQPLLPHINVHRPVQVSRRVLALCSSKCRKVLFFPSMPFLNQKLIRLCGEVLAAPTENEEIQFLCIVCAKLKQDPYLVNFFLEVSFFNAEGEIHWWHIFWALYITNSHLVDDAFCRTRQRSLRQRILEGQKWWRTILWLQTLVSRQQKSRLIAKRSHKLLQLLPPPVVQPLTTTTVAIIILSPPCLISQRAL